MAAYWWECESCGHAIEFVNACGSKGITHFIRDVLLVSSWDQSHLVLECVRCGKKTLRITYEFPRTQKEKLYVIHIVGLNVNDHYLPMMWETYPVSDPEDRWFDFKYINGRNILGLNKPAVFSREELQHLFAIYCEKTACTSFP